MADDDTEKLVNELTCEQFAYWREVINDALNMTEGCVTATEMDYKAILCEAGRFSVIIQTLNSHLEEIVESSSARMTEEERDIAAKQLRAEARVFGSSLRRFTEELERRYQEATGEELAPVGDDVPEIPDRSLN